MTRNPQNFYNNVMASTTSVYFSLSSFK